MTRVMDLRPLDVVHHDGRAKVVHGVKNAENGIRVVSLRNLKVKTPKRVRFYGTKRLPLVRRPQSPDSIFNLPDPYSVKR